MYQGLASSQELHLVIKNPSHMHDETFALKVPNAISLLELKQILHRDYPSNPSPERITIIHAGKVLKNDAAPLSSFLAATADNAQFVLHIVIKPVARPLTPLAAQSPAWRPTPTTASTSSTTPAVATPPSSVGAPSNNSAPQPSAAATPSALTPPPSSNSTTTPLPAASTPIVPDPDSEPRGPPPGVTPTTATPSVRAQTTPTMETGQQDPPMPPTAATQNTTPPPPPHSEQPYAANMGYATQSHSPFMGMPMPHGTMPALVPSLSTMYSPVYVAAYNAALQALIGPSSSNESQAESNRVDTSTSQPEATTTTTSNSIVQPHAVAFVPTFIPMPQPVFPAAMFQPHPQQQQQNAGEGAPYQQPPFMVPVMPYAMQYGPEMQLRERRRPQHITTTNIPPQQLAAVLRAARDRQGALPPALEELLRQIERPAVNPNQAPQQQGRMRRRAGQVRHIHLRFHINVRMLLQLMVLLVVLYQHCSAKRFITLVALGMILYLTTIERVRQFLLQLTGVRGNQQRAGAANAPQEAPRQGGDANAPVAQPEGNVGADNNNNGQAQQPPEVRRQGIFREVQAVILGFLTSLLPGWNVNAEDRQAFAAAQGEMFQNQEQAAPGPF